MIRELLSTITSSPKWNELSAIAKLKVVQSTIFIPVLGYFLLFSDYLQNNYTMFGEYQPWKIYCLYFGLTFLAIATLLYNFCCPKMIKSNSSVAEYLEHEGFFLSIPERFLEVLSEMATLHDELPNMLKGEVRTEVQRYKLLREDKHKIEQALTISTAFGKSEYYRSEWVHGYYSLSNTCRIKARRVVFGFFVAGFIVLAGPSIWTFGEVIYQLMCEFS